MASKPMYLRGKVEEWGHEGIIQQVSDGSVGFIRVFQDPDAFKKACPDEPALVVEYETDENIKPPTIGEGNG